MKPDDLYLSHDLPHHNQPIPDRALSFSVCRVGGGDEKGVSSNGGVSRRCVLMQGIYIYTYKMYIILDYVPY